MQAIESFLIERVESLMKFIKEFRIPTLGALSRSAALLFVLVLSSCVQPQQQPTNIASFTASPSSIEVGAESTLSWKVNGPYHSIELWAEPGGQVAAELDRTSTQVVNPEATTEYTLRVTPKLGAAQITRSVTVTVTPVVPGTPQIVTFEATPDTIDVGDPSELSWVVIGNSTSITILDGNGDVVPGGDNLDAIGTLDVSPIVSTIYTLRVTRDGGADVTDTVTVTVNPSGNPTEVTLAAQVVSGSQLLVNWTGTVSSYDLVAVDSSDAETDIATGLTGFSTTIAIPASNQVALRIYTSDHTESATFDITDLPIVTDDGDYDPYDSLGFTPQPAVDGTLRQVLHAAAPGTIIGFASDVTVIDIYGVEVFGGYDAHLILHKNVTLSGPSSAPVVIRARSRLQGGDPDLAFTYRSRVMLIEDTAAVQLENLEITGGAYISSGAGIRNRGTLTLTNVSVTENRAWDQGGGIFNDSGASLTLDNSSISRNTAATFSDEVGEITYIRNVTTDPYAEIVLPDGGFGGGLFNSGSGTVVADDTNFTGNFAKLSGGGIYNSNLAAMTLNDSDVQQNTVDYASLGTPINTTDFNYFSWGGGIMNVGVLDVNSGELAENFALDEGGALRLGPDGETSLIGTLITDNTAQYGGAIRYTYCPGELHLDYSSAVLAGNVSLGGVDTGVSLEEVVCVTSLDNRPIGPDSGRGASEPASFPGSKSRDR